MFVKAPIPSLVSCDCDKGFFIERTKQNILVSCGLCLFKLRIKYLQYKKVLNIHELQLHIICSRFSTFKKSVIIAYGEASICL